MPENPYKYSGPLHPVGNASVCLPRTEMIRTVMDGIFFGDYWAIFGPRQIGKTTFLFQLMEALSQKPHLHMYELISPTYPNEVAFYTRLANSMVERFASPGETVPKPIKINSHHPALGFYDFLAKFKPVHTSGKLVLFFDEPDHLPYVKSFLQMWRKVYHERHQNPLLAKYSVVMAGSRDLISLSIGPASPYNIAKYLYLADFTEQESDELILSPMQAAGASVDEKVPKNLWENLSGHPQMIQHACYLLLERVLSGNKYISPADSESVLSELMKKNDALETLKNQIRHDVTLANLLIDLLNGNKKKFLPYKDYSIADAGPVVNEYSLCKIRNAVFAQFLRGHFEEKSFQRPSKDEPFVR